MVKPPPKPHPVTKSLVLYCLIVDHSRADGQTRFLAVDKNGASAFPPTKFRPHENLYRALERILRGYLGLPAPHIHGVHRYPARCQTGPAALPQAGHRTEKRG